MIVAFICSRVALLVTLLLVSLVKNLPWKRSLYIVISIHFFPSFILSHKELLTGAVTSSGTDNGSVMAVHSAAPSFENMFHHGISSSVPNSLSSVMRVESAVSQSGFNESIHSACPLKFDIHGSPAFHPHSLPEYHNGSPNCANCGSTGSVSASINVRQPERIDNRHFPRVSSGHSLELNDSG